MFYAGYGMDKGTCGGTIILESVAPCKYRYVLIDMVSASCVTISSNNGARGERNGLHCSIKSEKQATVNVQNILNSAPHSAVLQGSIVYSTQI